MLSITSPDKICNFAVSLRYTFEITQNNMVVYIIFVGFIFIYHNWNKSMTIIGITSSMEAPS